MKPPYIDEQTGRFVVPYGQKWPWVKQADGKFAPEPPYQLGDSVPCESNEFHRHMRAGPIIVRHQWASNLCRECGDEYEAYMQGVEDDR